METRTNEYLSSPPRRTTATREDTPERHRTRSNSESKNHRRERQKPSPDSGVCPKRARRDRDTPSRGSDTSSGRESTPSRHKDASPPPENHPQQQRPHQQTSVITTSSATLSPAPVAPIANTSSATTGSTTMSTTTTAPTERTTARRTESPPGSRRKGTPRRSPATEIRINESERPSKQRDETREEPAPSSSSTTEPNGATDPYETEARPHPLGCYVQAPVAQQAMDLTGSQPSIIVGTPSASTAIGAGNYVSPVVMLNGSEATVLDTSGDCIAEVCDNLTRYTNSIDFSTQDSRFQIGASSRRNIACYRGRLLTIVYQYNELVPDELHARYHKGAIHFSTTVMSNPFHLPDGTLHNWATMMVPRATGIHGGFFLLTSLKGNPAVVQPTITRGGAQTALMSYQSESSAPPARKIVKLDVTCMFFTPYRIPDFGVRMIALDEPLLQRANSSGASFGIMSPVKRSGATTIALFSGLTWCIRTAIGEHGSITATYSAWFECTQENAYDACKFWRPGPPAVYECGEHEVTITVENMYVVNGGRKLIGTLAVRSCYFTPLSLRTEAMPSMAVLRFELHGARHREPPMMFATNPTCHLDWPLGETNHEIPVYSPYDIQFKNGRHAFSLELRYFKPPHRRCFLASSPANEMRFHTAMTVWRPDVAFRATLVSHIPNLQLHRGTQVATLYLIHATEGDVYQINEQAALKLIRCNDSTNLYVGDLKLPRDNVPFYDEL